MVLISHFQLSDIKLSVCSYSSKKYWIFQRKILLIDVTFVLNVQCKGCWNTNFKVILSHSMNSNLMLYTDNKTVESMKRVFTTQFSSQTMRLNIHCWFSSKLLYEKKIEVSTSSVYIFIGIFIQVLFRFHHHQHHHFDLIHAYMIYNLFNVNRNESFWKFDF